MGAIQEHCKELQCFCKDSCGGTYNRLQLDCYTNKADQGGAVCQPTATPASEELVGGQLLSAQVKTAASRSSSETEHQCRFIRVVIIQDVYDVEQSCCLQKRFLLVERDAAASTVQNHPSGLGEVLCDSKNCKEVLSNLSLMHLALLYFQGHDQNKVK